MAASPRPPSWAIGHTEFNVGVLGETALPEFRGCGVRVSALRACGTRFRAQRTQRTERGEEIFNL